ncbi:Hypothetical predicted protein [Lecanosticta acicola]|uniref:Endoplasmic reticulum lectin n=1 Tax=Lecanosticta acicola TaxID=111012 RepID=A0AAI8Z4B9_9PEZI|nr:Hypothetical predicted protein [Lecanosticta acicola]
MKHFFALPALLRCSALLRLAAASQHTFSVQDDMLAFPQYEVKFVDDWTSEEEAHSKLLSNEKLHLQHQNDGDGLRDAPPSQVEQYKRQRGSAGTGDKQGDDQADYEHMVLDGQPWLCRIPKVKKPEDTVGVNDTLTKAEEERELARATDRGWELLSGMQGNCVFFISGWWSYQFCYNQHVRQFHQLPPGRSVPVYPPLEDPGVPGFTLGTYEKRFEDDDAAKGEAWDGEGALQMSDGSKRKRSGHGELVQRGESRYLVQRLGGGTVCDLTGKERKVEVQFHCNQQTADRISLIKETSTCAYLMVIQTPRLCSDVAFLPPQKDQPNGIECSPVLREDEVEEYERDLSAVKAAEREANIWEATAEAAAALGAGPALEPLDLPVGDIYIGEHRLVPEGKKIEKSAIVGGGKETYIDTVATSDGKALSKADLEKLGVSDTKPIEKLKKELEKIAQGQAWKLDVIDTPRGREYRGIIGDDEEEEEEEDGAQEDSKLKKESKRETTKEGKTDENKAAKEQKNEGSEEEYYKEEL